MFNTEATWLSQWEPTLTSFGLPFPDGLADDIRGTNNETGCRVVRQYLGEDVDAQAILAELHKRAYAEIHKHIEAKPGLYELLDYLHKHNIPCAVATSTTRELTSYNLERAHIAQYFSAVVCGDDITRSKPDPEIFLLAAARLGVEPAHTIVLEDSRQGIRAAHTGGFLPVMVPDLTSPSELTDALVVRTCSSLLEVRDLLAAGTLY